MNHSSLQSCSILSFAYLTPFSFPCYAVDLQKNMIFINSLVSVVPQEISCPVVPLLNVLIMLLLAVGAVSLSGCVKMNCPFM